MIAAILITATLMWGGGYIHSCDVNQQETGTNVCFSQEELDTPARVIPAYPSTRH